MHGGGDFNHGKADKTRKTKNPGTYFSGIKLYLLIG
jgi:isopentenyl phosphate kinase